MNKKNLVDFRITAHLVANEIEARQRTRDKRLRECWKCPFQWGMGVASHMFVSVFIHVLS